MTQSIQGLCTIERCYLDSTGAIGDMVGKATLSSYVEGGKV